MCDREKHLAGRLESEIENAGMRFVCGPSRRAMRQDTFPYAVEIASSLKCRAAREVLPAGLPEFSNELGGNESKHITEN